MIVIDTSALMAIVLEEPEAEHCRAVITSQDTIRISACTIAEAMIVAHGRKVDAGMEVLLRQLDMDVVSVTPTTAERVAQAYQQWGKGNHPASLNFGDCFAYALAKELGCPLLFVGNDLRVPTRCALR